MYAFMFGRSAFAPTQRQIKNSKDINLCASTASSKLRKEEGQQNNNAHLWISLRKYV